MSRCPFLLADNERLLARTFNERDGVAVCFGCMAVVNVGFFYEHANWHYRIGDPLSDEP